MGTAGFSAFNRLEDGAQPSTCLSPLRGLASAFRVLGRRCWQKACPWCTAQSDLREESRPSQAELEELSSSRGEELNTRYEEHPASPAGRAATPASCSMECNQRRAASGLARIHSFM